MQSKRAKAGSATVADEGLGDPIRLPSRAAVVVGEHERVGADRFSNSATVTLYRSRAFAVSSR